MLNIDIKKGFLVFCLCLLSVGLFAQQSVSIVSWNLKDFGKAKSEDEIAAIARIVKDYDVLAIQEVVPSPAGPTAVGKLVAVLNRSGASWDYVISNKTTGISASSAERYAFLWKKAKITKLGDAMLAYPYQQQITREPFLATFRAGKKQFTLVNFHAIPKAKQPETEIKYLKFFPSLYPTSNLIFCGDFNLPESHSVFNSLKNLGYQSVLINQKTSLRQKCINNDCLASAFDNFFLQPHLNRIKSSGVIHFYKIFADLKAARKISDHVPIFLVIE